MLNATAPRISDASAYRLLAADFRSAATAATNPAVRTDLRERADRYNVAADLMANGWTIESAMDHVEGACDRAYCTGDHGPAATVGDEREIGNTLHPVYVPSPHGTGRSLLVAAFVNREDADAFAATIRKG